MNKEIKELVESFVIDSSIFDIDDESYLINDYYKYYPKTKEELIDNINELLSKGITDLNCICTSYITDMSHLFDQIKIEAPSSYFIFFQILLKRF